MGNTSLAPAVYIQPLTEIFSVRTFLYLSFIIAILYHSYIYYYHLNLFHHQSPFETARKNINMPPLTSANNNPAYYGNAYVNIAKVCADCARF